MIDDEPKLIRLEERSHLRVAGPPTRPLRPRKSRRRRYRYWRRHTPHYYIVLTAISCAVGVCVLEGIAFRSKSVQLAEVAFVAIAFTALIISTAFFWGFFMVMNGNIPAHRLKYLVPHGAVGVLSPLLYTLNICLALDGLGREPVGIGSLVCSVLCLVLLGVQFSMGKAVVHRTRPHLVPYPDTRPRRWRR
jgi:hypothetical protein